MPNYLTYFLIAWMAFFAILIPIQIHVSAPYGRHVSNKWGKMIPNYLGWIIMEGWALPIFIGVYLWQYNSNSYSLFFAALYVLHYIYRALIYPFRIRTKGKKIPLTISFSAMFFNTINAGINAWVLARYVYYPQGYCNQWPFIVGILLFVLGVYINISSDNILIHLRKPGEIGYKIPFGGAFKYVSCANMFGEIIEWTGYAIMCWHLAAVSFLFNTAANLIPRAIHHHRWYLQTFPEYPQDRKAIIPFVL